MPFVGTGPFYPANGGGVGASNDKIAGALPAVNNSQTCSFATSTTQREIVVKPGVAAVTTAPVEGTPADFGWNIEAVDMDAAANTPAMRLIPTGTWTFNTVLVGSTAEAGANFRVHVRIQKRASGGALTPVASGYSAATALVALAETAHAISVASVPEIVLDTGETIQLEFHIDGRGNALGQTVTFRIGDATSATDCRFTLPSSGLGYKYPRSLSTTLTLAASVIKQAVKPFTTTLTLSATGTPKITAARAFSTSITLTSSVAKRVGKPFTTTLTLASSVIKRIIPTAKTTTLTLTSSAIKRVIPTAKTTTLTLTATASRSISAFRAFSTTLSLSGAITRSVIAVRGFSTTLTLTSRGDLRMPFTALNRIVGGGGTTIIKRFMPNLFDD